MAGVATWSRSLEVEFIAAIRVVARDPRLIATSGKNLRATGWRTVLATLGPHAPTLRDIDQLRSKWKRIKSDYTDYGYLLSLEQFESGLTDRRWADLDAEHNGKQRLSRFRYEPFAHYDEMVMALSEMRTFKGGLRTARSANATTGDDDSRDDDSQDDEESDVGADDQEIQSEEAPGNDAETLAAAPPKTPSPVRKRKRTEDDDTKRLLKDAVNALQGIERSLERLATAYMQRNSLPRATAGEDVHV
ncbi:hypothetical protein SDRG_02292 [Saprolegnia diclina VS20]|uniref:Myb/SANT-like domain-containing protein n=1 Tax=Saprolegnia diclina (strain VS20) TaxID=1156394 RepID=T0R254_SAPDV|nr:hypothetical protein SDRG_02292 [Saprolegnia diclina VS20]EQC40395.1 hypothetical protein SDRG_02292 [Saprolegnia diclina VS20]|eukprot:XP_008606094.1 hypothetical protein SDRG_02292 [Saprolegnia diclina VS20]